MPSNQNPVFTDDTTVLGDGTRENPLSAPGGGSSPGGAEGDIQVNDGSGGFTNAQGINAGCTIHIDPVTGDILIFGTRFLNLEANNSVNIVSQPGNQVVINTPFAQGDTFIGNSANVLRLHGSVVSIAGLQVFANNADAIAGGLVANDLYRTGADPDAVCIVH